MLCRKLQLIHRDACQALDRVTGRKGKPMGKGCERWLLMTFKVAKLPDCCACAAQS